MRRPSKTLEDRFLNIIGGRPNGAGRYPWWGTDIEGSLTQELAWDLQVHRSHIQVTIQTLSQEGKIEVRRKTNHPQSRITGIRRLGRQHWKENQ